MKRTLQLLFIVSCINQLLLSQNIFTGDCDQTGMAVNVGSQEHMVSLYHGGPVYTMPSESNIVVWEITDMQGNLITKDTIVDDAHYIFYHDISITDTINVSAHFTNHAAIHEGFPINCLIEDQLSWVITEDMAPSPLFPLGVYTEKWTFVHDNLGVDQNVELGIEEAKFINKRSLVKIVDVLGKETLFKTNTVLFYIYDDGSVQKKYISR
tara:strand:+ start:2045 stop:2674 length:630 start_codon:yes stop_codon:yes gene_type:complete